MRICANRTASESPSAAVVVFWSELSDLNLTHLGDFHTVISYDRKVYDEPERIVDRQLHASGVVSPEIFIGLTDPYRTTLR